MNPRLAEEEKRRLREEIRLRIRSLSPITRSAWDLAIGEACTRWLAGLTPGCLLLTHPLADEPDLSAFHDRWSAAGWRLAAPRMLPGTSDMIPADLGAPPRWVKGPSGALEPLHESTEVACASIAALLIPARALDAAGNRLGRGGGSFDRLLARIPAGIPAICTLYSVQVMEQLPVLPHDRPVSAWIDESGLHAVRSRSRLPFRNPPHS